jgi:SM-20-related protein
MMPLLDLDALRRAPLVREPFPHVVVRGFVPPGAAEELVADFPAIASAGLLPVAATHPGPGFSRLIEEIRGAEIARAFSEKFELDLSGRSMMVTVRGRCQQKDGRIHTDTASKLVTALLYFNRNWEAREGRLRLLRGPDDLEDMIAEVPPEAGTLVAFRRSENSFHGHHPYVGVRRYVMFNWMTNSWAARREMMRHRLSAGVKTALPRVGAWLSREHQGMRP